MTEDARPRPDGHRWTLAAGVVLTIAFTAFAVAVPLTSSSTERPVVIGVLFGLLVAVPATVGLLALARNPSDRFARLLIPTGFLASTLALTSASGSLAYSTGRLMDWIVEIAFAYLILSFPAGRLSGRWERSAFVAVVAMALLLWLPTALFVSSYPVPTPWAECGLDCPPNAFQVTASEPAIIEALVRPLREALFVLVWLGMVAILVVRAHRAGPLLRRTLIPLVAALILRIVCLFVWFVVRGHSPESTDAVQALGWLYMLTPGIIAIGFGTGLLLRRLYAAIALEQFVLDMPPHPSAVEVRDTLRRTLDDPSLRIFSRAPSTRQWIDEHGAPASPPPTDGSGVTTIEADGAPVAAIVHDEALAQDRALLRAAARFALTAIDNDRLVADLRSSLHDLSHSRARTAVVADETRRRIERDLHDGAQQRLVALLMMLSAAAEDYDGSDPAYARLLRTLGDEVEQTVDELRQLARGIYPAVLTERGLPAALSAAALISPIATSVQATGDQRYRPEIESAVYFACLEALQNSIKHAAGATQVVVWLKLERTLAFEVRDDGCGFEVSETLDCAGSGLANLHDRLAAVGGAVVIESAPGQGTRVTGVVPAAADLVDRTGPLPPRRSRQLAK